MVKPFILGDSPGSGPGVKEGSDSSSGGKRVLSVPVTLFLDRSPGPRIVPLKEIKSGPCKRVNRTSPIDWC